MKANPKGKTYVIDRSDYGLPGPKSTTEIRYCHCGTKLSRYNLNETCFLHTEPKQRRTRGKKADA